MTFDISPEDLAAKGMGLLEGIKWKNEQKRLLAAEAKKRAGIQVFDDDGIDWSCEVHTTLARTTFLEWLCVHTGGHVFQVCTQVNASSAPKCRTCARERGHKLDPEIVRRAKAAMAGIFEEGGSDTKSHIKSVFGNMFERKQLRHQPAAEEKTQTEPQISPLMMVRTPPTVLLIFSRTFCGFPVVTLLLPVCSCCSRRLRWRAG